MEQGKPISDQGLITSEKNHPVMSAGNGPLTAQRPNDAAQTAETAASASTSSTMQKRPFNATETQHVAPSEPRSRPIFKMKRTGHSGPFPLSGRPVFQPTANGKQTAPSPSISSAPTPASLIFSGTMLNDLSRAPRGSEKQTIKKPISGLSLDIPDSNSPSQSHAQTSMGLIIGGHTNITVSRTLRFACIITYLVLESLTLFIHQCD